MKKKVVKKKPVIKKTKPKKHEDGMILELNGSVDIIDTVNGVSTRSPIDGYTVLQVLVHALTEGVKAAERREKVEKYNQIFDDAEYPYNESKKDLAKLSKSKRYSVKP